MRRRRRTAAASGTDPGPGAPSGTASCNNILLEAALFGGQADLGIEILAQLSVVDLWRLRAVSSLLRRWSMHVLSTLDQPATIGGRGYTYRPAASTGESAAASSADESNSDDSVTDTLLSTVEVLDWATLRWREAGALDAVPPLPHPRAHALCCRTHAGVFVGGGLLEDHWDGPQGPQGPPTVRRTRLGVVCGSSGAWEPVEKLGQPRFGAAAVFLPDGRVAVFGEANQHRPAAQLPDCQQRRGGH
jgi:hypothetical protein